MNIRGDASGRNTENVIKVHYCAWEPKERHGRKASSCLNDDEASSCLDDDEASSCLDDDVTKMYDEMDDS